MKRFTLCLMTALMAVMGYAQTLVTPPADAVVEKWTMTCTENGSVSTYNVQVATKGTDIFIEGLGIEGSWVAGTVSGTNATFAKGQYVGEYSGLQLYLNGYTGGQPVDIVFAYDAEKGTMQTDADIVLTNASASTVYGQMSSISLVRKDTTEPDPTGAIAPPSTATVEDWNISFTYNYNDQSGQSKSEEVNEAMKVAFDGSDIYFYLPNPISENAWVKGTLSGTTAVFAKNQVLGTLGSETAYFAGFGANGLCDVEFSYNSTDKVFTLGSMYLLINSSATQASPWAYYSQVVVSKEVVKDPDPVEAPENLTTQEYVFKGTSIQNNPDGSTAGMVPEQWNVRVGFVGSKEVYIQGLCQYMRDAWVKGTIDDGVLKLEKGQYYGKMSGMKLFFAGAFMNELADAEFTISDGDFAGGSYYVVLNSTADTYAPYSVWAGVTITKVPDVAATPATPSVDGIEPYNAQQGAGMVFFNVPDTDVSGNPIRRDNLSYRMWIQKGEEKSIYTFQKPTYYYVEAPMTEVPYFFSDGYDFYMGGSALFLFDEMNSWDKIGVQTIYKGGNETHMSDIGWYDMKSGEKSVETGISEVAANRQAAEATFDLQGRRVGASARGLVIRQQRMADGTMRTVKVLK